MGTITVGILVIPVSVTKGIDCEHNHSGDSEREVMNGDGNPTQFVQQTRNDSGHKDDTQNDGAEDFHP